MAIVLLTVGWLPRNRFKLCKRTLMLNM